MPGEMTDEMRRVLLDARRIEDRLPDPFDFPPEVGRALNQLRGQHWNVNLPEMADVRCVSVAADDALGTGRINVVCFIPADALPGGIVYLHGGGWAFSPPTFYERFARDLAAKSKRPVLAIDYGLAPERCFPGPVHDVVAAWCAIVADQRRFGLLPGPLVLGGDSAGGNLALAAMLHQMAAERPQPAGGLMLYGVYSGDLQSPSALRYAERYGPSGAHMEAFLRWYVPEAERIEPLAMPLHASDSDLMRLPPLFLLSAELDSLAWDTEELVRRLRQLGRGDTWHCEPGVVHGFLQMGAALGAADRCTRLVADAANALILGAE